MSQQVGDLFDAIAVGVENDNLQTPVRVVALQIGNKLLLVGHVAVDQDQFAMRGSIQTR
jgi:hypothetical protein